jgi:protein TonB
MFQTIGRDLDVDRDRRRMTASAITALLVATVVCTAGLYGAMHVHKPIVIPEDGPMPTPLDLADGDLVKLDLPGLPPAAPPAPAPREPVTPKAPEEPAEPTRLDPVVPPAVVSSTPPAGPGAGPLTGTELLPGGTCPTCTGTEPGGGGGGTGSGYRTFHQSEVQVKRRVQPIYPDAARAMGIDEASCRVRVKIDETGFPQALEFEDCPPVFQPSAEAALKRWRWYPAKVGDVAVPAQFVIVVKYRAT